MASGAEESEAFAAKIDGIVKDGCIAFGLELGLRTGLLLAATEIDQPFTSEQLESKSGCKKSMIEQWLLQMATGDIVDVVNVNGPQFSLSEERKKVLLDPTCMVARTAKYLPYFHAQMGEMTKCMRSDGPNEMTMQTLYGAGDIWEEWQRSRSLCFEYYMPACVSHHVGLQQKLDNGCRMLEIGSNDGRMIMTMATIYPRSTFVGSDINKKAMEKASHQVEATGPRNLTFCTADALNLPAEWTETFDYVAIIDAFLHLSDQPKAAEEIRRVLKPGGHLTVIEIPRGNDYMEDVTLPNAIVTHTFGMIFSAMGSEHEEGHELEGDGSQGQKEISATLDEGLPALKSKLIKGGFENLQVTPLPRTDVDDAVHIFTCK